jgi:hypothetical protein
VDFKDNIKKADVGIAVGGGVELGRHLSAEGRFTQSLMDIRTDKLVEGEVEGHKIKNRVISILLGWSL